MRNALRMAAIAVVLCATSVVAHAGDNFQFDYEFTYPGTACNQFGVTGLGPNGGVEIVNWSNPGSPLVDCPFVRDADGIYIDVRALVDVRGNVSCTMRAVMPNGSGWIFYGSPAPMSGYTEISFPPLAGTNIMGGAIECVIPPGAAINNYRVSSQIFSR